MAVVLNLGLNLDLFENIFLIQWLSWRRMGKWKVGNSGGVGNNWLV